MIFKAFGCFLGLDAGKQKNGNVVKVNTYLKEKRGIRLTET